MSEPWTAEREGRLAAVEGEQQDDGHTLPRHTPTVRAVMAREIIVIEFMSLDGVVDSPGHRDEGHPSGGWVVRTEFLPESFALKERELDESTALLFGRRSYELFAPVWRDSDDHVAYRDLPKFVVSSRLAESDLIDGWGETTILRSTEEVAELKRTDGGAIFVHGSAELARRLSDADLIDRYHLLVFPVLLGSGKRLFSSADRDVRTLRLRSCESYANGLVALIYDVHAPI
jgi:dihydrofolate reductase